MELPKDLWLCPQTLDEVVEATRSSYLDGRHHYPFSITLLKQIAINAFWIVKLKPIKNTMIHHKKSKLLASFPNINEAVAVMWIVNRIEQAIETDNLTEVVSNTPGNIELFRSIIDFYYNEGFYRSLEDQTAVEGSCKVDELIHNLRYKKFTAVNLYEVICHLILPFRAATVMPGQFATPGETE